MRNKSCDRAMESIESLGDTRRWHHGWLFLRRHVGRCSDCGAYLSSMESVIHALDGIQQVSAPAELLESVMCGLLPGSAYQSPVAEEGSHGHRGLLVFAGAAGLGVAVAIALAVWRHMVGQQGEEELASIGTA